MTPVWQATMALRFVEREKGGEVLKVLQQAWICRLTDDVEWRDIPVVKLPKKK